VASFEERLTRLEELAEKVRDRNVPLEEAMAAFEEGTVVAEKLEGELEGYRRKVEILRNEPDLSGNDEPLFEDFAADEES
jgi:exodeoxyribonuclease VII small subunit